MPPLPEQEKLAFESDLSLVLNQVIQSGAGGRLISGDGKVVSLLADKAKARLCSALMID